MPHSRSKQIADIRRVLLADIDCSDLTPVNKLADRPLTEDYLTRITLLAPPMLIRKGSRYNCVGNNMTLLLHRATLSDIGKRRVTAWVLRDSDWRPDDWRLLEDSHSLLRKPKLTVRKVREFNAMVAQLSPAASDVEDLTVMGSGYPDEKS